jgi:integrase/recombinase XerD
MDEDVLLFLDHLAKEKNYSPNTLAAYNSDLAQLSDFIRSLKLGHDGNLLQLIVDRDLLSSYMQELREKKYSVSTIARKVAAAKSFINFMVEKGKLKAEQAPKLASPQVSKPMAEPLTVSEVRRFLAEPAKLNTLEARRDKAMLELLYATGLRASELMALNLEDVNLKKGTIKCARRDSSYRMVSIDTYILKMIEEYIREVRHKLLNKESENALILNMRGERLTRQGFWQIIQGYAEKAALGNKVTPRSLRRSFAIHKLDGGVDLQAMQEMLGHAHISTTKAYKDLQSRS